MSDLRQPFTPLGVANENLHETIIIKEDRREGDHYMCNSKYRKRSKNRYSAYVNKITKSCEKFRKSLSKTSGIPKTQTNKNFTAFKK